MRSPPPVAVRAGGGAIWRGVQAALPALGLAVLKLWTLRLVGLPMMVAAPAALLLGVAIGAWLWRHAAGAPKLLAWDGAAWSVDGMPVTATISIDLGGWLLLRLRTEPAEAAGDAGDAGDAGSGAAGSPSWLAVSSREAGPAWHGLRVALMAAPALTSHLGAMDRPPRPADEGSPADPGRSA